MDKKAVKALQGSIKKWERIILGTGEDLGRDNCPLCWEYHNQNSCDECPVRQDTGAPLCEGNPYEEWIMSLRKDFLELTGYDWTGEKYVPIGPHSLATAITEYEYLCGLLDKELAKK